jgi:hypothetical protein
VRYVEYLEPLACLVPKNYGWPMREPRRRLQPPRGTATSYMGADDMIDLIHRLFEWVSVLVKGSGGPPPLWPSAPGLPVGQAPSITPPLPPHRSPYAAQDDTPLDGTATSSVRPYLLTHEQHQHRRRLATATPGQAVSGPYWVHGLEAA